MTGVKADEMLGKGEYEYALPFMDTGDRSLSTRYLNQTPQSGTTRPSSKEKETK